MSKQELIDAIYRLNRSGWSTYEIARQLKVSEYFVVRVLRKG